MRLRKIGFLSKNSSLRSYLVAVLMCVQLNAYSDSNLPENWETRLKFLDSIISESGRLSDSIHRHNFQLDNSLYITLKSERRGDYLFLLFLAEDQKGEAIMIKRGNVSIKKRVSDGGLEYMTVFVRDHAGCYMRLFPMAERTGMYLKLFDITVYDNLKLPVRFDSIITAPISYIIKMTSELIDWELVLYDRQTGPQVLEMLSIIRDNIPYLSDLDDGAYDSTGNSVYIDSEIEADGGMNCSGFVKWVVDGFYYPVKGRYMDIGELKERLLDLRGNRWSSRYEEERDPYFGLDWSRNLACLLAEARTGSVVSDPEQFDVRVVDFFNYYEDVGFAVSDLEFLLFQLTARNPDFIYIGSINRLFNKDPALRQHIHLALLVPVIDQGGYFRVIVLERNRETSLTSLIERYGKDYIHLVGIPASETFRPLELPK